VGVARGWDVLLVRIRILFFRASLHSEIQLFLRFKLIVDPNSPSTSDSSEIIRTKAFQKGVLALPGTSFLPNGRTSAYVRASFSLSSEDQVDLAARRLREAIVEAREEAWKTKA
jgi:tryptophan aminotransferase